MSACVSPSCYSTCFRPWWSIPQHHDTFDGTKDGGSRTFAQIQTICTNWNKQTGLHWWQGLDTGEGPTASISPTKTACHSTDATIFRLRRATTRWRSPQQTRWWQQSSRRPFWMLPQAQWLPGSVHFQLKAFRWLQFLIGERKNIEKESNLLCHVYIEMSRLNVFGSNTSKLAHKNIGIHQIVSASPLGPWLVELRSVSVVDRCFD